MATSITSRVEAVDSMLAQIRGVRSAAHTLLQDMNTVTSIAEEKSADQYQLLAQTALDQLTKLNTQVQQQTDLFKAINQLPVPNINVSTKEQDIKPNINTSNTRSTIDQTEVMRLVKDQMKTRFESWRRHDQQHRAQSPIVSSIEEDSIMQDVSLSDIVKSETAAHPVRDILKTKVIPSLVSRAQQSNVNVAVNYMNGMTGLSQGIEMKVNDTFVALLDIGLRNNDLILYRIIIRETAKDRSTWEESPWSAYRMMTSNATLVADQLEMDYPKLAVIYFLDWLVSHHDLMIRPCQTCNKLFCFDSPSNKFLPPVARYPIVTVDEKGAEILAVNGLASLSFHRQAYHLTCL
ncbi:hypothetical protein BDF19DRAFT_467808 [Syncephalis fuscata]|nr:hypothetical protein BDF19DRAFT_467808 [Syncephalis fuscata]